MIKIQRFLGFTDDIKEPRKTKVENSLKKFYRYDGNVYNAVNYLCVKLLQGCTLEKEENYQDYKRNGELTKPRTLYKFISPDSKSYVELNKTEYDFVEYLINNGLESEKKMTAFDNSDVEKIEISKKAEQEAERKRIEEGKKKAEEKAHFDSWLVEESQKIPQFQKDIINDIFLDVYGKENPWNYTLAVCINSYDKPLCKEEIKLRLHNNNKASIKIFECLTGLKLPKAYKERMIYLDSITSLNFKEPKSFRPRKKAHDKDIELKEFYISERWIAIDGNIEWKWVRVIAEPIEKYGMKMFIRNNNGKYQLSLEENGGLISSGKTKAECMDNLSKIIKEKGKDYVLKQVSEFTKIIINSAGSNPLYD